MEFGVKNETKMKIKNIIGFQPIYGQRTDDDIYLNPIFLDTTHITRRSTLILISHWKLDYEGMHSLAYSMHCYYDIKL
jgi:hypothetical protein